MQLMAPELRSASLASQSMGSSSMSQPPSPRRPGRGRGRSPCTRRRHPRSHRADRPGRNRRSACPWRSRRCRQRPWWRTLHSSRSWRPARRRNPRAGRARARRSPCPLGGRHARYECAARQPSCKDGGSGDAECGRGGLGGDGSIGDGAGCVLQLSVHGGPLSCKYFT